MRRAGSDNGQAQRNVLLPKGHKGAEAEACFQWGRLGFDVSIYSTCGGPMKIIASIENPFVIDKILSHLPKSILNQ